MKLSALAAFVFAGATLAAEISGGVLWNGVCSDIRQLGQAKVVIDNAMHSANVLRSGKFSITDVPPGTHILNVRAHDYLFDTLRIDVPEPGENGTTANPVVRPYISGTPLDPPSTVVLPYPVVLVPRGKYNYFTPPTSFNALGMLQNPMMLIMGAGFLMVLAMPYLMKSMDPEALQDINVNQARIQSALASGDLKGGLSALMQTEEAVPAAPSPQRAGGAKKGKRR
ncbi:hypothetical protein BD626DRAFT_485852 [Schizophyllum amplum]|uniref:ER membrane protein complex subunit 7 beta-sandwich domain-containing protein n=1 Tax=Schizophyllum amplum TaxID=97359 RepID=A0A550CLY2_9AGAR|nr:hypothetical protein BD626DRAFT_485852 [Auriculariopsis ampla]